LEAELTAEAEDLKAFAAQAAMKARAMLDSRDAQNEPEEAQPLEWSKLNTGALPGNQVSISTEPGILAPGNQVYVWLKPEDDLMKVATYEYSNTTLRILSLLQRNDDEMEFRKSDLAFYKESYTFETCRLIDYRVRKAQSQMTVESVTAWLDIRNTNRDAVDNHWEFKITELQHLVRNWDQIALLIKHTAHKIDLVADMGYRFSGQQIMNQRELLKQYPTLLPEKQRAMQEEYAAAIDLLSAREAAEQAFRMQYGQLEASRPYHNEDPITNTNYDNA
jgi:hypothetical protein